MTFDLGKAQEVNSGLFAVTDSIVEHYESKAVKMFPDLIAEIERLRAKVGKMEFLMRSTDDTCLACAIKLEVIDQQAAHVQELEDALVEERARGNHYGMSYEDATDGNFERWIIDGEKDLPKFYLDRVRTEARRQLQAEGKIGPDATQHDHTAEFFRPNESPAKSWKITDERVEALKVATGEMDLSENIFYLNSLKTMLEEAGQ